MKLNKKLLVFLSLIISTSAHAKIYFDESNQRALVYYTQGDGVNASICEDVTEENLRTHLQKVLNSNCKELSPDGITKQNIEEKLPEFKKGVIEGIETLDRLTPDFIFSFQRQKKIIEDLTADQIFQQYQIDARVATLVRVETSKDLNFKVKQFVVLTKYFF